MNDTLQVILPSVVRFGALVFGSESPERALEEIAQAVGVTTIALGRIGPNDPRGRILAQNKTGVDLRGAWAEQTPSEKDHFISLTPETPEDILIAQSATNNLTASQRGMLDALQPLLAAFWQGRPSGFDAKLESVRIDKPQSMLHPDNPYGLTRAQLGVCALIAQGKTTQDIARELGLSLATVRTHLSQIYTKTGVDGMVGVLHHLQMHALIIPPTQ